MHESVAVTHPSPCMLSGHARTVRSVALLRATLALVQHSLSKSDPLEWPLRKLDCPCRMIQCFAVAPATLTAVSTLVLRRDW